MATANGLPLPLVHGPVATVVRAGREVAVGPAAIPAAIRLAVEVRRPLPAMGLVAAAVPNVEAVPCPDASAVLGHAAMVRPNDVPLLPVPVPLPALRRRRTPTSDVVPEGARVAARAPTVTPRAVTVGTTVPPDAIAGALVLRQTATTVP